MTSVSSCHHRLLQVTTTRRKASANNIMYLNYFNIVLLSLFVLQYTNIQRIQNVHVNAFTVQQVTTTFSTRKQQQQQQQVRVATKSTKVTTKSSLQLFDQILSEQDKSIEIPTTSMNRRNMFVQILGKSSVLLSTIIIPIIVGNGQVSNALVKGNAPPPKMSSSSISSTERPKCTNMDECQAQAEIREQQLREQQQAAELDSSTYPIKTTKSGTRYRDYIVNDNNTNKNIVVKDGDTVELYYKVLKLGKRSYDGISGEGTVVFSCGYGYEDFETKARSNTFETTIGSPYNIQALNDGIIGMIGLGSIRRVSILPDKGWRKPGTLCDGGPGGQGTGGQLRTDYVVVPTATIVETEKCFDTTKQPFPNTSFAQQRRMAQRFDQSLIIEIELVSIK